MYVYIWHRNNALYYLLYIFMYCMYVFIYVCMYACILIVVFRLRKKNVFNVES